MPTQVSEETNDLEGLEKISHSEIESFLNCERRHYYQYGLGLRSKKVSDALVRGIVGHQMLSTYFEEIKAGEKDKTEVLHKATVEGSKVAMEYENGLGMLGELVPMFTDYLDARFEEEKTYDVIAVEKPFKLIINDEFYISMIIDLIYRGWDGIVIRDHKFVYNFYQTAITKILPQLPIYSFALKKAGYKIDKAEYNEIRYRSTKASDDDPSLKFRIDEVDIPIQRLKTTAKEYVRAARRIKELKSMGIEEWGESVNRTFSANVCERCPFKVLCGMDIEGQDTSTFIELNYDVRGKKR